MTNAYPLSWPMHIRRAQRREKGQFKTSMAGALNNVRTSLRLFGQSSGIEIKDVVISSNVTLGIDKPEDPGVAVWFVFEGQQMCIPVDRYDTVAANLQAIHHVIEARRTELRHGTLALVRATFHGFISLPTPSRHGKRSWREVLGLQHLKKPDREAIEVRFRNLAKNLHPDAPGGSHEKMTELNTAREEAMKEIGR